MLKKTLTKKELAQKINRKLGYSSEEAKEFIDVFFSIVLDRMCKEEEVKIPELGNFFIRKKNERIGRNPKTKEEHLIKSRKVISFKKSNKLVL